MKHAKIFAGLVLFTGLGTRLLRGAVIDDETYTFPAGPTPYDYTITVPQQNYTFGNNPGQVNSITYTLSATVTTSGSVVNSSGSSRIVYSYGQNGDILAKLADNTVLNHSYPTVTVLVNYTMAPSETYNFSGLNGTDSTSTTSTDQATVGQFLGTGSINVTLEGDSTTFSTVQTGINTTSDSTLSGHFIISYNVVPEPLPEPSTWMAAGLLLGVVGLQTGRSLVRQRRQPVA